MKSLPLFFLLFSTLSFGQYIEKANLKIKKTDHPIQAKDIVYLDGKKIRFVDTAEPYVFKYSRIKDLEKFDFDSADFHKDVPKLRTSYTEYREGRGVYETMDDLMKNKVTDRQFRAKKNGFKYEFQEDLLVVIDDEDKRIKDVAGLLWQGDVYVSFRNAIKNLSDEEKGALFYDQALNTFVRVKYMNENLLYFEFPYKTMGDLFVMGGIGGMLGAVLSNGQKVRMAATIYYDSDKEFHALLNCKKFNQHLENRNKDFRFDCDNYELNTVRDKVFNEL
ncbi:MAG: hypothetical protein WBF83_08755 [Moheibacter sp.]